MQCIGDLVVVFQKGDCAPGLQMEERCSAWSFLPGIILTLKKKTPFCCRDKLLRFAEVVRVIAFAVSGQTHKGGMVEVIVPHTVEPAARIGLRH